MHLLVEALWISALQKLLAGGNSGLIQNIFEKIQYLYLLAKMASIGKMPHNLPRTEYDTRQNPHSNKTGSGHGCRS